MTSPTDLGENLTLPDSTFNIGGGWTITSSLAKTQNAFSGEKPNPGHSAMTFVLPTCEAAIAAAGANGIFDGTLLLSMAYNESRLNPRAFVAGGLAQVPVRGMVQFRYDTGTKGVSPPIIDFYNPADSLYAAAKYLKFCWNQYGSVSDPKRRLAYAVMGYNAGPGTSVSTHDSGTRKNYINGKVTKISSKQYAKEIDRVYKKFAGLPLYSIATMKFV